MSTLISGVSRAVTASGELFAGHVGQLCVVVKEVALSQGHVGRDVAVRWLGAPGREIESFR